MGCTQLLGKTRTPSSQSTAARGCRLSLRNLPVAHRQRYRVHTQHTDARRWHQHHQRRWQHHACQRGRVVLVWRRYWPDPSHAGTGDVILSGLLNVASGGTGQSSYTNGQLLIGNTAGNTLGKATLTAGSGIAITNGAASVTIASDKAYGSFYDTTTQSGVALTATAITFNSTSLSYNVAIGSPTSRIVVTRAGIYNVQFSAQISNPSAAIDDVTIWIRQNGVNIADSAGIVGTPEKHGGIDGHTVIGWNYVLQAAANDYFELYWITDSGTTQILTYPASASHPQAPSMILTVQQV